MQNLSGKTAFITGGASGIGLGIAKALLGAGMNVVVADIRDDHLDEARGELGSPERVLALKLDVTNRAQFAEAADAAEERFGKIHILCNNAGVAVVGPTELASFADWDWVMGVNVGGTINGVTTILPRILKHGEGGHIVNVASMAAYLSGPQAGIYTASKFAVRGLTESLRYNLAPYGIGVSLMCPGLTKTNAWDSALKRPEGFAESGFKPADKEELEQFGTAFDLGMDPLEVGRKTLGGMTENRGLIFTHPEFAEDFEEIYRTSLDALPDEPVPEGRLHIERLRREANRAATEGKKINLGDLT